MTAGGKDLAVDTIEKEYINNGNEHLRDDIALEKYSQMNACTGCCCSCFQFIIFVALVYFTTMYFLITNDVVKMKEL